MLSFVTNATLKDASRLNIFVPHVLAVFDKSIDELIIVVDRVKEEGRISRLHQSDAISDSISPDYIERLKTYDPRINIIDCDYSHVKSISGKWFDQSNVIRCQDGTPVFAFLFGIEKCKNEKIIRSDCDVFFYENGFLEKIYQDQEADIMQLPMLNDTWVPFSSRSFYINRKSIQNKLPLKKTKLDLFRRIHRKWHNRPPYLALEQIIENNIRNGRLTYEKLSTKLGYSMHVVKRDEFSNGDIQKVEQLFRKGEIPALQLPSNQDYIKEVWIADSFNED